MDHSFCFGNPHKGVQKEVPEFLNGADLNTFIGTVRATNVGAEADHVHFGIIGAEDATF